MHAAVQEDEMIGWTSHSSLAAIHRMKVIGWLPQIRRAALFEGTRSVYNHV
jgi:hypothetical protein